MIAYYKDFPADKIKDGTPLADMLDCPFTRGTNRKPCCGHECMAWVWCRENSGKGYCALVSDKQEKIEEQYDA